MSIKENDKKYIAPTYGRFPVEFARAEGSAVYDTDGKKYIDMGAGIATTVFGHCDSEYVKAVTEQLNKYAHASNLYYTEPQVKLAELLCEKTGMKKVFFANSGAEANEGMIKAARKYSFDKYGEGRSKIITLKNSFHGRTVTTLSATGQDVFHNYFFPFTEGFDYAPANDIEGTKALITDDVCAVMVELVQGEGGVLPLEADYVNEIYSLCAEKDILFCVDEVQTGNGRCGALYAYMRYNIMPDIISTAKGLGGGLPIGAVLLGEKTENTLGPSMHGSTFGGNPVCAAGAYNVISRIDDELLEGVQKKSDYIVSRLKACKNTVSVSGMGLLLGIKTTKDSKEIVNACIADGVLPLTAKDKIRLTPPLNISFEDLEKALDVICANIDK